MSAHDRYLAGHCSYPVDIRCLSCDNSFSGLYEEEFGAGWTDPEECPECGGTDLDIEAMSDEDIAERKAEARGEDF